MQKLVKGVHNFQIEVVGAQRDFFQRLAKGQTPIALFITCSDSRINPNLLTQTEPGDLFILRNAGNIVPTYSPSTIGGEAATIEYAVSVLGVRDIIICGHSHCGAMKGLLNLETLKDIPAVEHWLGNAEATRRIMKEKYADLEGDRLLTATVEENTLVQLENLRTHPSVRAKVAAGKLNLHAWVYKLETGEVFDFNPLEGQFLPLADRPRTESESKLIRRIDRSI
jgi:carbonic anhydrase